MPTVTRESDLRELIVRHAAELPPQQRLIADYLLEHLQTVPFLSVPELAQRTGVSEATVVRFAQRIGYSGFSELKMDLVELLQERLGGSGRALSHPPTEDVLQQVADLEIGNIRHSVETADRRVFAEVGDAIYRADHTYTFGMGISAHLAEIASYTLVQIGVRASALSTRFSSPREQVVALRPSDALLVLSFPPYSRQTLELLREAQQRGLATCALCDRFTAPAAQLARWALAAKSDNMMFTNAIAAITVLVNALAAEIATSHRERTLDALTQINRMLGEDTDLLPSDR